MSVTLRAVADAYRLGNVPDLTGMTPGGLHDLGDGIRDGVEACELVAAIEDEMREAADLNDGDATSLAKVWEMIVERMAGLEDELRSIRRALVNTGALDADDKTTDPAALIKALF